MFRTVIISIGILFSLPTFASAQNEINHLIEYVKTTNCTYERNGDMHNGEEAVEHIQRKYDYFEDDIATAEDFIKYSATKSTFSGKEYKIHCPGVDTVSSQSWLLTELNRYRNAN